MCWYGGGAWVWVGLWGARPGAWELRVGLGTRGGARSLGVWLGIGEEPGV